MEVGSHPDDLRSRKRRHFFQAGLGSPSTVSTSERAHPTTSRWWSRWERALSETDEPRAVPAPDDACPLWPCPVHVVLSDRAAPGWRHGGGGAWLYHSNHGWPQGRELSRPAREKYKCLTTSFLVFQCSCCGDFNIHRTEYANVFKTIILLIQFMFNNYGYGVTTYLVVLQVHSSPIANESPC